MSLKINVVQSVLPRLCNCCAACENHHELFALRSLYSDGSPVSCDIGERAVIVFDDLIEVYEVLVSVACVYDQQITLFGEAIEVCIVDGLALLVRDNTILSLV